MALSNEDLLAISQLLDVKLKSQLQPIENSMQSMCDDIQNIKLFQENVILPRLNTIEACYTSTYDKYKNYADKMEAAFADIEIMKKVIAEHSAKLQKIS